MRIWKLESNVNEYADLWAVKKFSIDDKQSFDGRSKIKNWEPIEVMKLDEDEDDDIGNITSFRSIPVFDKKAIKELEKFLKVSEILPLEYEGRTDLYYLINVTQVLDCIDYKNAKYVTFDDGEIMRFEKYAFIKEKVQNKDIFKIIDKPFSYVFVSDKFREKVLESNLTGFDFELVWESN